MLMSILSSSPIITRDYTNPTKSELDSFNLVIVDSTEDTSTAIAHANNIKADIVAFSSNKAIFMRNKESNKVYEIDYIRASAREKFSRKW